MSFLSLDSSIARVASIVQVFTSNAAAARTIAKQQAAAKGALSASSDGNFAASSSPIPAAQITLILEGTMTNAQSNPTPTPPRSPGSPGRLPMTPPAQPSTQPIAQLTFDIAMGYDGFAQTVSYSWIARQQTHQTAGGFYVDEFGQGPGSFALDVLVACVGDIQDKIEKFKAVLDQAKLSNPLSPDFAKVLRYANAYDGRSLLLTQTRLDVREANDRPNTLMVSIAADILNDYSTAKQPGKSSQVATSTNSAQQVVVNDSTLNYQSVDGSSAAVLA